MRQRVGLARALSVDAEVLLLDEPFSAVDEQNRRKFQEDLIRLRTNQNKTFIFVTHSIEEAVYISDRIVLLSPRPGRVSRDHRAGRSTAPAIPTTSTATSTISIRSRRSGRGSSNMWSERR